MSMCMKAASVDIARVSKDADSISKLLFDIKLAVKFTETFYNDVAETQNENRKCLKESLKEVKRNLKALRKADKRELTVFESSLHAVTRLNFILKKYTEKMITSEHSSAEEQRTKSTRTKTSGIGKSACNKVEVEIRKELQKRDLIQVIHQSMEAHSSTCIHITSSSSKPRTCIVSVKRKPSQTSSRGSRLSRSKSKKSITSVGSVEVQPERKENGRSFRDLYVRALKLEKKKDARQDFVKHVEEEKNRRLLMRRSNVFNLREYFEKEVQDKLADPVSSSGPAFVYAPVMISLAERIKRFLARAQAHSQLLQAVQRKT